MFCSLFSCIDPHNVLDNLMQDVRHKVEKLMSQSISQSINAILIRGLEL